MYYTYVLQSRKDKKLYIGYTTSIVRCLNKHQTGQSRSTKYRLPVRLLFYEGFLSKRDAMRREKYFKTAKGKRTLKLMLRKSLEC